MKAISIFLWPNFAPNPQAAVSSKLSALSKIVAKSDSDAIRIRAAKGCQEDIKHAKHFFVHMDIGKYAVHSTAVYYCMDDACSQTLLYYMTI